MQEKLEKSFFSLALICFFNFQEKENQGRDKIMSDISSFESSTLKATEIEEKNSLPTGDDINRERVHRDLLTNIGQCDFTYRAEISLCSEENNKGIN